MKQELITDYTTQYPKWDKSMKKTHKVLVPDMLPWHFLILEKVFKLEGYNLEILKNDTRTAVDEGLKPSITTHAIHAFALSDSLSTL